MVKPFKLQVSPSSAQRVAAQAPAVKKLPLAIAALTGSRAYAPKQKAFGTEGKAFTPAEGQPRTHLDFGRRANESEFGQLSEAVEPPLANVKTFIDREAFEKSRFAREVLPLTSSGSRPAPQKPLGQTLEARRAETELRGIHSIPSVTTPQEFVLASLIHVSRVSRLARELFHRHESAFPGVNGKLLARFVDIHDAAKVFNHPGFLKEFGLEHPLAEELVQHWGTLLKSSPQEPHPLVDKVNRVDWALEQRFFNEHGIGAREARYYRLIVEICDKADRGMATLSRYEEMGKTALPVGEYLRASTKPRDKLIAHWAAELEAGYHFIIPEALDYFSVREKLGVEGVAAFGQTIPAKW